MFETFPLGKQVMRKASSALGLIPARRTVLAVLLSLLCVALLVGRPATLAPLRARLAHSAAAANAGQIDVPEAALARDEGSSVTLTSEMSTALEFVAKRYRVSADALAPVFRAAQAAGRQMNLDPLLIIAVIAIESKFNPFAESIVGAQGLMQVVPRWHQDKLPEGGDTLSMFDPEVNVRIGTEVLRDSIRRMGGLIPGLQQFAGAIDDPGHGYANKILAEKQRLESAVRRAGGG